MVVNGSGLRSHLSKSYKGSVWQLGREVLVRFVGGFVPVVENVPKPQIQ